METSSYRPGRGPRSRPGLRSVLGTEPAKAALHEKCTAYVPRVLLAHKVEASDARERKRAAEPDDP